MDKEETKAWKKAATELENLKHEHKLIEIEAEKQAKLKATNQMHDNEMERQRIKGAEIRKSQQRRMDREFVETYHKQKGGVK